MTAIVVKDLVESLDVGQILPPEYAQYRPLLADALCFFIERLPKRRLAGIIAQQLGLHSEASFAERALSLFHQCPTLHKLGQIVARDRRLSQPLRHCLQQLESVAPKTVLEEIPPKLLARLRSINGIQLSVQPLAEASVAVILPFVWRDSTGLDQHGVFKVLKPGVEERLGDELEIWGELGTFLEDRCERYGLPLLDYRETLDSMRLLLGQEVCFEREQQHLKEAAEFYRHDHTVVIPRLLPHCSARVTAMERIQGRKVTDTGMSSQACRHFAETLIDAMIARPFWALGDMALFHADPHAGNLFCTPRNQLAILDWTLVGRLEKGQRIDMMQIVLGGLSHDRGRICRALRRLGRTRPDESRLQDSVARAMKRLRQGSIPGFDWSLRLLDDIALSNTMAFPENLMLFRKSLLTLSSVIEDVASGASIDSILLSSGLRRFCSELPARVMSDLDSRALGTHVSNLDLMTLWVNSPNSAAAYWLGAWQDYLDLMSESGRPKA